MRQEQNGGEASQNLQAGRDIVIASSLDVATVREIALDVYKANFMDLGQTAADIAFTRAERLTNDFLSSLGKKSPDALQNTSEPDVRRTIYNAQAEFACSGEEDLRGMLVDLLVARTQRPERDVMALALNEAVSAAPRLTRNQRAALAVMFVIGHTAYMGKLDLSAFFSNFERNLSPFVDLVPTKDSDYQHLASVGVATSGLGLATQSFAARISRSNPEFFRNGYSKELLESNLHASALLSDRNVFIPALRDPANMQLSARANRDPTSLATFDGKYSAVTGMVAELGNGDLMAEQTVRTDFIARLPMLEPLVELWDTAQIRRMNLTSTGIAIGHTLWAETTGDEAGLGIWL